jgi:site-specific DNA-methyltransferase (adenine-specific)
VLYFDQDRSGLHQTAKPVALIEYLLGGYTNEGDIILDPFMGSGTTAVACQNTNRNYIGIELHEPYVEIAKQRLTKAINLFTDDKFRNQ